MYMNIQAVLVGYLRVAVLRAAVLFRRGRFRDVVVVVSVLLAVRRGHQGFRRSQLQPVDAVLPHALHQGLQSLRQHGKRL